MPKPLVAFLLVSCGLSTLADAQLRATPVASAVAERDGVLTLAISRPAIEPGATVIVPDFPLPGGGHVSLEMTSREAFAPDAQLVVVRGAAEERIAIPEMTLLSGSIAGDERSRAFLSFSEAGVQGFIQLDGRTYVVSSGAPMSGRPTVIYDLARLPQGVIAPGHCAVEGAVGQIPGMLPPAPTGEAGAQRGNPCRRADLAIETDHELLANTFGGNAAAATAYVAALTVAVSDIYHNELNTRFRISFLRLWEDSNDPWTQEGSTVNQLFEWQDYWNANMRHVTRTTAHFLSGRPLGGGVAYVGALCYPDYDYGLSANLNGFFPYPLEDHHSQNWDLMVVAHELGHNFGTGHTHDQNSYNPVIDGCGLGDCSDAFNGTIMSYCHTCPGGMTNINLHFGPRVATRILEFLDAEAPCDIRADARIDEHPHSHSVYRGGTAKFSVAAGGAGTAAYQWRFNGDDIENATSPFLVIGNVQRSQAGNYDVVVTTECSSATSDTAVLTVLCPADFDADGFVTGIDFDLFVYAFQDGNMSADFDGDGFVSGIDFDLYVYAFEEPC